MPCLARVTMPCVFEGDGGRCTVSGGEAASTGDSGLEVVGDRAGDAVV
jgi:hypothetical protein